MLTTVSVYLHDGQAALAGLATGSTTVTSNPSRKKVNNVQVIFNSALAAIYISLAFALHWHNLPHLHHPALPIARPGDAGDRGEDSTRRSHLCSDVIVS